MRAFLNTLLLITAVAVARHPVRAQTPASEGASPLAPLAFFTHHEWDAQLPDSADGKKRKIHAQFTWATNRQAIRISNQFVPASGTGALGDASHRSHQPDSWLAARTWNHCALGATPYRCGIAWDPGRRQRPALRRIARAAAATEAGARSLANADRRSRCHDQQGCWRERSLPTAGSDPWHRTGDGDCNHRRDRQWSSFQKGARVFRVARNRPGRIYHWWQAKAAGD